MKLAKHIIHKLLLDIETRKESEAYEVKDQVDGFLQHQVLPGLEMLFDRWSSDEQIYRFERLEIDIRSVAWNNPELVLQEIDKQLGFKISEEQKNTHKAIQHSSVAATENQLKDQGVSEIGAAVISGLKNQEETLFLFLQTGTLPWHAGNDFLVEVWKSVNWKILLKQPGFIDRLQRLMLNDLVGLDRFVYQVPLLNILELLAVVEVVQRNKKTELALQAKAFSSVLLHDLLHSALHFWLSEGEVEVTKAQSIAKMYPLGRRQHGKGIAAGGFEAWMQTYFTPIFAEQVLICSNLSANKARQINPDKSGISQSIEKEYETFREDNPTINSRRREPGKEAGEPVWPGLKNREWIVADAGQVLYHPFLSPLFKNLGWLDNTGILKEDCRELAVQALHYCASGKATHFEADLLLSKYLCAFPLDRTLPASNMLTSREKREATLMVKNLIEYWPELKNTSPAGFREMFVQRQGKFSVGENGIKLLVERKVQDVLLEKLNWNLSVIKLPWHNEILYVEW